MSLLGLPESLQQEGPEAKHAQQEQQSHRLLPEFRASGSTQNT